MQNVSSRSRHATHVAARGRHRLLDRRRHLARLAVAETDLALAVTDHRQRGETELAAALHDLGDAIDRDQLLDQPVGGSVCSSTLAMTLLEPLEL